MSPLAIVLCCQALLMFTHLDLLSVWGDELFTMQMVALPITGIVSAVQRDIHPPLYYVLLHEWVRLPLPWSGVAALRAFSALSALLATFLFDRCWLRHWKLSRRWIALVLFAFSPSLLLYGRMARSYALQTALTLLAISLLWRWLREPRAHVRLALPAFLAVVALLYTHYLPALAVLAAFALMACRRIGFTRVALFCGATAVAYAPWAATLVAALWSWRQASAFQSHYALSGNWAFEQMLKIAVASISFTIGESFYLWSLPMVPVVLALMWRGCHRPARGPSLAAFLVCAGVIGYAGATRWVTWPFMAPRLLWLLPFLTLALALGLSRYGPMPRRALLALILISSAASATRYFEREGYVNLGYAAPLREITGRIKSQALPSEVLLVDGYNTDASVLTYYLKDALPLRPIHVESADRARELASGASAVWVVRNTRDVSPGQVVSAVEADVCRGRARSDTFYERYSDWQSLALRLAGSAAPDYFYQVSVCR